jgi:hypothetical protein
MRLIAWALPTYPLFRPFTTPQIYGFMAMPKQNAKHQFKFAFYPDPTGALRGLKFYSSPSKALESYSSESKLIFCAVKKDNVLVRYFECTAILRRYAKDVALDVIHLWKNPPEVILDYLNSDDESKRDAVWAAARATVLGAARAAAWAAARAATRDGAWSAARAAAWAAAWDVAKAATRDATRAKYDKWLIDRLTTPITLIIESTKNEAAPH